MIYKKNADGTDMLDENGNPIPDENANKEAESEKDKVIKNLVEEIKDMRAITAAFKDKLQELEKPETPPTPPSTDPEEEKIVSAVEKVLGQKRSSDAQANKTAAFDRFVSENKEFHPDNDAAGLKLKALVSKFNVFNTSGLYEKEEFYSVIRDAHRLLTGSDKQSESYKEIKNPYSSSPTPQSSPTPKEVTNLTPEEQKVMRDHGWSEEKFLKLKANHADMIADLMRFVRV